MVDFVLAACAKLMQEFKDGKSGEWNLDYWIHLAWGEVVEEEPISLVDEDQVVQGQEETAAATTDAAATTEVIDQPIGTDPIVKQSSAVDQSAE